MIPILYSSTETAFTSNGIGRLRDCISCTVTEERNGKYECEFQYPVTGRRFNDIEEGCFVSVTHDDNHDRQPFRIYRKSAPLNGIVTFNARHISYDLNNIILQPFTGGSVTAVFAQINGMSINNNPFTFWTDKTTVADFALDNPASVRSILGGVRGSILDVYGGEYQFDGLTVKLYNNRGVDTDITLRYGKNIIDIDQTIDSGDIYDACVPFWSQDGVLVTVSGYIVMHGQTANRIVALDMTQMFDEQPTETELLSAAQSYLNNNQTWVPKENIKVDFVALWQTDRYKDVAVLQRVKLCDTVNVYVPHLGITIDNVKVVKVVYNVLGDRYDEIELGEARSTFAQTLTSEFKSIVDDATRDVVSKSVLDAEIERNTQLITGGLGGHVVYKLNADGQPEEILVMDTDDIQTAVHVWRWNQNGFAHSSNGYNGPFNDIALTADGHINASMITVGFLTANLIRAGVISDATGESYWDLDSGEMKFKGELEMSSLYDLYARVEDAYVRTHAGTVSFLLQNNGYVQSIGETKGHGTWFDSPKLSGDGYDKAMFQSITSSFFPDNNFATNKRYSTRLRESIYASSYGSSYNPDFERIVVMDEGRTLPDGDSSNSYTLLETFARTLNSVSGTFYAYALKNFKAGETSPASALYLNYKYAALEADNGNAYIRVGTANAFTYRGIFARGSDASGTVSLTITSTSQQINNKNIQFASTSSRRYKKDIKPVVDAILDPHRLYNLEVKQFRYHDGMVLQYDDMAYKDHVGFIAEEVDEVYPDAVIHDIETGQIESWDERRIIPPMLKLIQEQKEKIDELEARIARLEKLMEV